MEKKIIKKTITSDKGRSASGGKKVTLAKVKAPEIKVPEIKLTAPKVVVFNDKNIKISPRKLRLLATSIKKISPLKAQIQLSLTNTKAARVLSSAIKTIVSVAKNNYNLLPESLKFDSILVNEGQKIKRMDKSHGSHFARGIITKRHSRLTIKVIGQTK